MPPYNPPYYVRRCDHMVVMGHPIKFSTGSSRSIGLSAETVGVKIFGL